MYSKQTKELYHYTSLGALDGILKNQELWFGNAQCMNDSSESVYFFDKLKAHLCNSHPDKQTEIEDLFNSQLGRYENEPGYVFSLSKNNDDAAQWDRYANKCGVCIVFDRDKLIEFAKPFGFVQEVFYGESIENHQIKALLDIYLLTRNLQWGFTTIDGLFDNAWTCSFAFKSKSFSTEAETRVCLLPYSMIKEHVQMHYVIQDNRIREFVKVPIDPGTMITRIVIGPGANVDEFLMKRYLRSISDEIGNIAVERSLSSLR